MESSNSSTESSKSTTIGIALIMLVFLGWWLLNSPKKPAVSPATVAQHSQDSLVRYASKSSDTASRLSPASSAQPLGNPTADSARLISTLEQTKRIETPLYIADFSSRGAAIKSFVLKKFVTYDKKPLDLVNKMDYRGGDINLKYIGSDGKTASTFNLPFVLDTNSIAVSGKDSLSFTAVYKLDSSRRIEKIFTIHADEYLVTIDFHLVNMMNSIGGYHYAAAIDNPLPYLERQSSTETAVAESFAGIAGSMEDLSVKKVGANEKKTVNGDITFVGSRTQYFVQALIPLNPKTVGADLEGSAVPAHDGGVMEKYVTSVTVPISHQNDEHLRFHYYLGPLEYSRIANLNVGLEQSMNFGWSFIVRPISIYGMLPLLMGIHSFVSNWGLVIIIFSILIKLVTIPLSSGQMRSMKKMQVLQPKVTELREKYKEDAKKMNEELLKLYRTYGVNPAGGCLPMLLQMPILFALYAVLRNVIELRQAPFAFWIKDLSAPDALFHFSSSLPLIGSQLSGLTLLLVITMFVQQQFTVTDPRQKSMAYIMPLVFMFMFNNLPSGVALYYFVFNMFGLLQQFYLTRIATPPTLESMKVDPKKQKSGGIMAKLQDMEKTAREQRKGQYTGKKN